MNDYDKDKESSYLQNLDVNNLYDWVTLQKLSVDNFDWIKETCQSGCQCQWRFHLSLINIAHGKCVFKESLFNISQFNIILQKMSV